MNWGRFIIVVLIASVATSFSDWLFMGIVFHDKYLASPEIWRSSAGRNERRLVICSQLVGVLSVGWLVRFIVTGLLAVWLL
jgi:hypothetical protein